MCNSCYAALNPIALPFAFVLMWIYQIFQGAPDNESRFAYALALALIAIIVRVVLLPFQMKSKRGMLRQSRLQPKLAELQKRHGANKQKYQEEMAKLYKEEGVNPASGCLWSFIMMPIMIALFMAIRQPLSLMMGLDSALWASGGPILENLIALFNSGRLSETGGFYIELTNYLGRVTNNNPEMWGDALSGINNLEDLGFYAELFAAHEISEHWEVFRNLGIENLRRVSFYMGNVNLAEVPNFRVWEFNWGSFSSWSSAVILFLLPIASGGMQFLSMHISQKSNPQAVGPDGKPPAGAGIMKFMPLMSVWFGFILPGALSLYWTIGTGVDILRDMWLTKKYTKILDAEDAEKALAREKKEAEIEAKRLETERLKAEGIALENRNKSKRKKEKLEKQEQRQRAAEWEKKNLPEKAAATTKKDEPGRVGDRRYARGRAYDPDRFDGAAATAAATMEENNSDNDNANNDSLNELDDNAARNADNDTESITDDNADNDTESITDSNADSNENTMEGENAKDN